MPTRPFSFADGGANTSPPSAGHRPGEAAPAPLSRIPGWLAILLAVGLALSAVAGKSVTFDEFQALPHGLATWQTGRYTTDRGVPPASKLAISLPAYLAGYRVEPRTGAAESCWEYGDQFEERYRSAYYEAFLSARAVSVLALAVLLLVVWRWADRAYGTWGGVLALSLTAFNPNLLAHGALITTEIFFTLALVSAVAVWHRHVERPTWRTAAGAGLLAGLAGLCKFSAIPLLALLPLGQAAGRAWAGPGAAGGPRTEIGGLLRGWVLFWVAALGVVHLAYGGVDSLATLGDVAWQSPFWQSLARHLPAWTPLVWPAGYLAGFDIQMAETGYEAYLLGHFNQTGFPHYYLVAFLVKTPELTLLLGLGAVAAGRWRPAEITVTVVVLAYALIFSLTGHKNIGIRYLLFLFPLLAFLSARLAPRLVAWATPRWSARRLAWTLAALTLAPLLPALSAWPDFLPYFNTASGGPTRGHRLLLDSNLDWGQDLIALRHTLALAGAAGETIDLAYGGRVDPATYGLSYQLPGTGPPARFLAVSANLLWGRPYFLNGTNQRPLDRHAFAVWRNRPPLAVPGYSIYLFRLPESPSPAPDQP